MTIIKKDQMDSFTNHLNQTHPAIKFTHEIEVDGKIPMLDTTIIRNEDGSLRFEVYRKPTNTDQYLDFNSHQPLEHKLGVIRTLTHRADTLCSTSAAKQQEVAHIRKSLSICHYPRWAWDIPSSRKTTAPRSHSSQPPKGNITLPYIRGLTEALSRKIRSAGVRVHVRPQNTIRSQLVAPKDKTKTLDQAGVVYQIQCEDCPAHYVGETERQLGKRIKEHQRPSSPVHHHMDYNNHNFKPENVKIMDRDSKWLSRGIRESIHIARTEPPLNRDRGRHHLPAVYGSILQSRDNDVIESRD